jgi:hypothetical protein
VGAESDDAIGRDDAAAPPALKSRTLTGRRRRRQLDRLVVRRRGKGGHCFWLERFRHGPGLQADDGVAVKVENPQVRIRAPKLGGEGGADIIRLGSGEASFSGAEPHEHDLILLTALELERSPVGTVGHDRFADLWERQRLVQPGGIRSGQVPHELAEESLEICTELSRQG